MRSQRESKNEESEGGLRRAEQGRTEEEEKLTCTHTRIKR